MAFLPKIADLYWKLGNAYRVWRKSRHPVTQLLSLVRSAIAGWDLIIGLLPPWPMATFLYFHGNLIKIRLKSAEKLAETKPRCPMVLEYETLHVPKCRQIFHTWAFGNCKFVMFDSYVSSDGIFHTWSTYPDAPWCWNMDPYKTGSFMFSFGRDAYSMEHMAIMGI